MNTSAVISEDREDGILEKAMPGGTIEKVAECPIGILDRILPLVLLRVQVVAPFRTGIWLVVGHGQDRRKRVFCVPSGSQDSRSDPHPAP
ncbi:MAG: hypothetical protein H6Q05_4705 [Acidobacteria bacterium]|nr:hypothetical protein [Acidobacteriota bacterium]